MESTFGVASNGTGFANDPVPSNETLEDRMMCTLREFPVTLREDGCDETDGEIDWRPSKVLWNDRPHFHTSRSHIGPLQVSGKLAIYNCIDGSPFQE